MSDQYGKVKTGKLTLKGEKKKHKKKDKKRKREREEDGEGASSSGRDAKRERKRARQAEQADTARHGGWWAATQARHISGPVAVQVKGAFVKTLDDGSFTLGGPHDEGAGPDPEEVLLAIKVNESKVAFKSGYEKYLRVEGAKGTVKGTADAVGPMEQWEPVFQDGKMALLGPNGKFLGVDAETETVVCVSATAGDDEMVTVRSNAEREEDRKEAVPEEEQGGLGQVELNYVKKFQKFQDHKIRLNNDDRRELIRARAEGDLHETLLDRRAKMKADRYCK